MMNLCNGDVYRPLTIEVMDFNGDGNHTSLGEIKTNVKSILDNGGKPLPVIESNLVGTQQGLIFSKDYENSGILHFKDVSIERNPTFTEFIKGKMEVSFMVIIFLHPIFCNIITTIIRSALISLDLTVIGLIPHLFITSVSFKIININLLSAPLVV